MRWYWWFLIVGISLGGFIIWSYQAGGTWYHIVSPELALEDKGSGLEETDSSPEGQKRGDSAAFMPRAVRPDYSSEVLWLFNNQDQEWESTNEPPACDEPLTVQAPTGQLAAATHVLYPGQIRGNDYKAHGGFRFDSSNNSDIDVRIPLDAKLMFGSRYIERGDTQYYFVFIAPCGIAYKLDHLLTLTPKFQMIADQLPPSKENHSRTTPFEPPVAVTAGEQVATAIGFETEIKNVSFDFGVYDLRAKNTISSDLAWAAEHQQDQQFAPFGVCWLDLLPPSDRVKVRALPGGDSQAGVTSDYCQQ